MKNPIATLISVFFVILLLSIGYTAAYIDRYIPSNSAKQPVKEQLKEQDIFTIKQFSGGVLIGEWTTTKYSGSSYIMFVDIKTNQDVQISAPYQILHVNYKKD